MSKILTIRLSALGDVAMLIPVLYSVAGRHPDDEFILLTKSPLLPLFEHRPQNITILPVYSKGKHKGFLGLFRLLKELSREHITTVADTHDVLRSKIIRTFFRLKGKKTACIDKGRKEKRKLTRRIDKVFIPLKTSIERYQDVFTALGYESEIRFTSVFEYGKRDFSLIEPFTGAKDRIWIGIAPLARYKGKIYPLSRMKLVVTLLAAKKYKIFLFGGKEEIQELRDLAEGLANVEIVAGKLSFSSELLLMSYLDLMITMDSGNMHLASLVNTPVISIWGATHSYAGFYGYKQDPENIIQLDMDCRPCSIYGNRPCYYKTYDCLYKIPAQQILEKVYALLP